MIKIVVRFENSAISGYTSLTMVELMEKMEGRKDRYLPLSDRTGKTTIIIDLLKVIYIEKEEY